MEKKRKSRLSWRSARSEVVLLAAVLALAPGLQAQQLESEYRLTGKAVTKAFDPIREVLQKSSAVVLDGWKSIGYGVVVSSDGQILVKASEIADLEEFSVRVDKTAYDHAEVVAISPEWDVALVKVDAKGLVPVVWADEEVEHGTWVVSNGSTSRSKRRVRVGIISANTRAVGGAVPVVLGVVLNGSESEGDELEVRGVKEGAGAEEAGVLEGDIIKKADKLAVETREELLNLLKMKSAGDELELTVEREGELVDLSVKLAAREDVFEQQRSRNEAMSGRTSSRRTSFERVIQHDIGLSERSVGGPLLNLDGECVGMNIARFSRAESFAIPADELRELLGELLQEPASAEN